MRGLPRGKFRRQGEAHIFANQIQVALIGETQAGQPLAYLLDQNFGRGSAGGEAERLYAIEPGAIHIVRVFDQPRGDSGALRDFHQAIGIRAVGRADHQDQLHFARESFDGFLAILCGVANVV